MQIIEPSVMSFFIKNIFSKFNNCKKYFFIFLKKKSKKIMQIIEPSVMSFIKKCIILPRQDINFFSVKRLFLLLFLYTAIFFILLTFTTYWLLPGLTYVISNLSKYFIYCLKSFTATIVLITYEADDYRLGQQILVNDSERLINLTYPSIIISNFDNVTGKYPITAAGLAETFLECFEVANFTDYFWVIFKKYVNPVVPYIFLFYITGPFRFIGLRIFVWFYVVILTWALSLALSGVIVNLTKNFVFNYVIALVITSFWYITNKVLLNVSFILLSPDYFTQHNTLLLIYLDSIWNNLWLGPNYDTQNIVSFILMINVELIFNDLVKWNINLFSVVSNCVQYIKTVWVDFIYCSVYLYDTCKEMYELCSFWLVLGFNLLVDVFTCLPLKEKNALYVLIMSSILFVLIYIWINNYVKTKHNLMSKLWSVSIKVLKLILMLYLLLTCILITYSINYIQLTAVLINWGYFLWQFIIIEEGWHICMFLLISLIIAKLLDWLTKYINWY